jgi:hypothetical protein
MIMSWVVNGAFHRQFRQAMLGGTFGQLRAWRVSQVFCFSGGLEKIRNCNRECLGAQGRIDSPRNRDKVRSWEMHSFGGKGIAQNQRVANMFPPNPRQLRRWLRFFAIFPCHLIVLSYDKYALNMFVKRY